MSFNVRDDGGIFGPAASIELGNGAAQSSLVKMQLVENVTFSGIAAANDVNTLLWLAPASPSNASSLLPLGQYSLTEVAARWSTAASVVATMQIERTPTGTGVGSGTNLLSAAVNLQSAANTTVFAVPSSSLANANAILSPGDGFSIIFSTSPTTLANLVVTLSIARVL